MIHSGIDLVKISRIEELISENKSLFLKKICTPKEIERLNKERRLAEKVAAVFSLKEAFSKALGTGFGESLSFLDLEVTYSASGRPQIEYCGEKFRYLSTNWNISCSVSHEEGFLVSMVILDGDLE